MSLVLDGIVWCDNCGVWLRCDLVVYWAADPLTPRCVNCERPIGGEQGMGGMGEQGMGEKIKIVIAFHGDIGSDDVSIETQFDQ